MAGQHNGGGKPAMRTGRARFFSCLDETKKGLEAGYTYRYMHELLKERSGLSYAQFCRYVRKYITEPESAREAVPASAGAAGGDVSGGKRPERRAEAPERFSYDPAEILSKKDELL